MFTGEYRHSVDDKGRMAVPVKFRLQLGPGSMISGWLDDCLAIHPKSAWDDIAAKVAGAPFTDERTRRLRRAVFARAVEVETDKQGRVVLPAYMRELIGLTNEAVILGSMDHAEIWAPDRWEAYRQALDDPQELARAFQGLEI